MEKKQLNYQETERKRTAALFEGMCGGYIMGKERYFALKDWEQNLWDKTREAAIAYFDKNEVGWHVLARQGHILSSQVCCINHLFPIRNDKESVLKIIQTICADFIDVLPITTDKYFPGYILFEAVSDVDHLNEGAPTRGSNCTSVDALIYAVHKDGRKYIIPIEWKYTEKYDDEDKSEGESGKRRLERYSNLIKESKYLNLPEKLEGSIYFYEPFYQLMRQTLWAEQMVKHRDTETIKAEDYIHIHIIPNENDELLYKKYKISKKPLRESWLDNLKDKGKYIIISPMDFIKNIDANKYSDLIKYLQDRYWSGKIDYIRKRYWENVRCNLEYSKSSFKKFDDFSGIGMDVRDLFDKLSEDYPPMYGPMGLLAPEVLTSKEEDVLIIDYGNMRNATVYVIFYNKKTYKITRKIPYKMFLKIYNLLLKSGFTEIKICSWREIFKDSN